MTPAQLATFKTAIAANATPIPAGQPWTGSFAGTPINAVPNSSDGNAAIAGWYNMPASPNWTVWKTAVTINEVGNSFNASELAGLSTLNNTRLQTLAIYMAGGVNPSLTSVRAFFDDIFSGAGGVNTRASLLALWKRLASNVQKLFSTGTGSDAVPATPQAETGDGFVVSGSDVLNARNL